MKLRYILIEQVAQFKAELQTAQQKHEQLLEQRDEMDHLREENKRLSQEHGEDQQVIHLLEMQKNILAKNQVNLQSLYVTRTKCSQNFSCRIISN